MTLTWEQWLALDYEQLIAAYKTFRKQKLNWFEGLGMRLSFTDELLDFLNETMLRHEILLRQQTVYLAAIAGLPPPEIPGIGRRNTTEPQEIMKPREVRSAGNHVCDRMADCRRAIVTIVRVESSLDQDVEIETIGNIVDSTDNFTAIGVNNPCPADDRIDILLYGDYWHPWVGIRVIAATAPTAGSISAQVVNQE